MSVAEIYRGGSSAPVRYDLPKPDQQRPTTISRFPEPLAPGGLAMRLSFARDNKAALIRSSFENPAGGLGLVDLMDSAASISRRSQT